jgi:hypothetical protein
MTTRRQSERERSTRRQALASELEALAYCGHAWEDETRLGIVRSHRQQAPSFTEKCGECVDRLKSHTKAFELAQGDVEGSASPQPLAADFFGATGQGIGADREWRQCKWCGAYAEGSIGSNPFAHRMVGGVMCPLGRSAPPVIGVTREEK